MSSSNSSNYQFPRVGHKRGISETSPTRPTSTEEISRYETAPAGGYKSIRQSLRPLPQPPSSSPNPSSNKQWQPTHSRIQSLDEAPKYQYDGPSYSPVSSSPQTCVPSPMGLSRTDSVTPSSISKRLNKLHKNSLGPALSSPDLTNLKKSTTSHLRTLSKFAQQESSEDFSLTSPAPSVVGLQGRRQLKRTDSTRGGKASVGHQRGSAWTERNWIDKQRQFLQAYEYLCHIGEAKEWIEDIIHNTLPPIVQLEEALRDGVTLAEIVLALYPNQPLRIFRHPKLQFRHSDNIAVFFRFLAEVELPELFRFELIDLYEKKNIPKVIYCIHALSWLLYRKGIVDFRIGNLVGQLEFEHHELEEMQKGLDKAGISMPSFAGMGASFGAEPEPTPELVPEPEPVESEAGRIERELGENKIIITDFQAQARGAMIRISLGQKMQDLWGSEIMLGDLQAVVRGGWARQIFQYRLSMKNFAVNLQSASRGFLERTRQRDKEEWWKGKEKEVVILQSLIRAKKTTEETKQLKTLARREESGIKQLQAAIRGAMQRKSFDVQYEQTRDSEACTVYLQAALRGVLHRRTMHNDKRMLEESQGMISMIQAATRGMATRFRIASQEAALENKGGLWLSLQAISRGLLLRRDLSNVRGELLSQKLGIIRTQAVSRGKATRDEVNRIKSLLSFSSPEILLLQSAARGFFVRKRYLADLQRVYSESPNIVRLQSCARAWLVRQKNEELHWQLHSNTPEVINLQALSRAMMLRVEVEMLLNELEDEEPVIVELQSLMRGKLVREKFAEKQQYFKANMEKVVKVQSFIRGRLQGEAYKSLTNGTNPPVGTVKGFVHLLNDSDFDFDEEVEFERLRKTVVQHVRQNEMADQYITQLDIKIALLVKNKITLDEVVKHQKHFGGETGSLLTNTEISSKDPFDLKALNKTSRRKLEHYQELFFILQTQPQYLARLFRRIREHATAEKECERVKHLMMGLFGYSQKRREEYYLIKLITRSLKEEIDNCSSIKDYLRGNFFWAKLFGAYVKSPRDRKYMRDILGPIIKDNIIENPDLDLESDPMQIYLSAIENEQLRTGQRSHRNPEIPREEAIRDEETKRTFITHLQDLRDIADQFFAAFEDNLHKMPYGVRYIAQQMFQSLTSRFKHDEQGHILQIVGHWIWKSYLQPALIEPDKFGVVDRGISQDQKRNLGEVAKVLGQVAAGRLFGGDNVFLQPLNSYVGESIQRLGDIWNNCKQSPDRIFAYIILMRFMYSDFCTRRRSPI